MHLLQGLSRLVRCPIEKPFGVQFHGCNTEAKTGSTLRSEISKMLTSSWSKFFFKFFIRFASVRPTVVIISCSYYRLLFLQLDPLAEDILHQTPNMNAVTSLQKIIEIQSTCSKFFFKCVIGYNPLDIYCESEHMNSTLSFSHRRNIFRVTVICTCYACIPKCVSALLFIWQAYPTVMCNSETPDFESFFFSYFKVLGFFYY